MKPKQFVQSNTIMESPKSDDPNFQCQDLAVYRGDNGHGQPCFISCWTPSKEELDEIVRTGRVWLQIYGVSHPPVWLSGLNPFIVPLEMLVGSNIASITCTDVYQGEQYAFTKLPEDFNQTLEIEQLDSERYRIVGLEDHIYYEPVEVMGLGVCVQGFETILENLVNNLGFDLKHTVVLKRTGAQSKEPVTGTLLIKGGQVRIEGVRTHREANGYDGYPQVGDVIPFQTPEQQYPFNIIITKVEEAAHAEH